MWLKQQEKKLIIKDATKKKSKEQLFEKQNEVKHMKVTVSLKRAVSYWAVKLLGC